MTKDLTFTKSNIQNIPFQMTILLEGYCQLGLGHNFLSDDYCIVHQLYNQGYIKSKSFALRMIKGQLTNYLYFGGIPLDFTRNKHKVTVKTKDNENGWLFHIDSVSTKSASIQVNKNALLGFGTGSLIVDKNTYDFLKENVFNDVIKSGMCKENVWNGNSGANIKCEYNRTDLPLIYLNVNNNKDQIPIVINERDDNTHIMDLCYNSYMNTLDYFVIDRMFFYQYIVLFDYSDLSISLYVNNSLLNGNNHKENDILNERYFLYKRSIIIINLIMLLIFCGIIGINKFYNYHAYYFK
jgi:ribosomal protein S8